MERTGFGEQGHLVDVRVALEQPLQLDHKWNAFESY
jgi:hypothetical protein